MIGEALNRDSAGQILGEQPKALRVLEVTQGIHLSLGVAGMRLQRCSQFPSPLGPVRFGKKCPAIEQLIEQYRMPRQMLRCPGAGRHQLRKSRQYRRMFDQQR